MSKPTAAEREPLKRQAVTDDQASDIRRQLLTQRLAQLEAEHVAAVFAVDQIERQIEQTRTDLQARET